MKIVVLGGVYITPEDMQWLRKVGEVVVHEQSPQDEADTVRLIADAAIVVAHLTPITEFVLVRARNLTCLCLAVTGCDTVDLVAAAAHGVTVCYAPGYATDAVAEHTIGLMLAAVRHTVELVNDVRSGVSARAAGMGMELAGKTLGIIGCGRIGSRVATIAQQGFGMCVRTYDQHSTHEEFELLLAGSDIISLHVPLTSQTRRFVQADILSRMRWGAVLINTARGGLIDEQALLEFLSNGHIAAAGLDVLVHEPMSPSDPLVQHKRVIVTPHIAYKTHEALVACSRITRDNIAAFLAGSPVNVVST